MARDEAIDRLERLDRATRRAFESMAGHTPGGRVVRRDGLLLVIGVHPSPVVVNTILPETDDVTRASIEAAVGVYATSGTSRR